MVATECHQRADVLLSEKRGGEGEASFASFLGRVTEEPHKCFSFTTQQNRYDMIP